VVAEALRSTNLELLVVHDLFKTPTGQLADYLLPASHWLEKSFFSTGYAYLGFVGDYAAANSAAIPTEFGHRSDYDLWRDLSLRLGDANDWPDTVEEFWDQCLLPAGLTFNQLAHRKGPWINADAPTPGEWAAIACPVKPIAHQLQVEYQTQKTLSGARTIRGTSDSSRARQEGPRMVPSCRHRRAHFS